MLKKYLWTVSLACIVAAVVYAGGSTEEPENSDIEYPLEIVATTGMVGDIVTSVVGDRGVVSVLMDDEVDPHLFRPTRSDIARMQQADMIFYNGLNLEGQMGDTLVQLARTRPVFAVTELVEESVLLNDEAYDNAFDPHLWMDVSLWMQAVEVVVQALSDFDPSEAEFYRANGGGYRSELEELHAYARETIGSIPDDRRILITAHDAFGYLGAAYDLEVIGVQGLTTESEAGLGDINNLVNTIVENRITAIFAETTVADRALMAVIEGAASRGHDVRVGGELFSDAMGPSDTYEGTYIGMIDHNVTTIARALGGSPPRGGLNGRLSGD
ncbi:MAG: metal ABC transporter solute-binding protein, Zn/Mn family [Spirochaetota bacterium]